MGDSGWDMWGIGQQAVGSLMGLVLGSNKHKAQKIKIKEFCFSKWMQKKGKGGKFQVSVLLGDLRL